MFSQHVQDTTSGRHVYEKGNTAGKQHRKALLSRIIDCLALKYSLDRAYVDDFIHEKVVYIRFAYYIERTSYFSVYDEMLGKDGAL